MNIYIISAGDACKVGVAKDVENRIVALRTGSPHPLTVQHTMRCKNSRVAYKIENICHRILADKRLEGEWFACTPIEAVIALNEAVLEFAANDLRYVDVPRGGEVALSSRAMRYVNAVRLKGGLKVADIVDEALVEHYGPIVDGVERKKKVLSTVIEAQNPQRIIEKERVESIIRRAGKEGITKGRLMDRLKIYDRERCGRIIDELVSGTLVSINSPASDNGRPRQRLVWNGRTKH